MLAGRVPSAGPSTFFVGRERCRLPEALELVGLARRLAGFRGSLSLRAGRGFLISSSDGLSSEDDVVEVEDYDPVRHSCLVIGLKEPSADLPIHWMAYRTDEPTRAAAFVREPARRDGVGYIERRHPAGSFPEALEIAALAKRTGAPAGAEGRGYLVRARTPDELIGRVAGGGRE